MVPMEIVRVITFALRTLKIPIDLYTGHKKLGREMKIGLESLMYDLDSLKDDLESSRDGWRSYDELQLTELAYDIEDFAQGLWIPGASGPLLSAIGMNPCSKYVESIKTFKERILKLERRQQQSTGPVSSPAARGYIPEESLVGIDQPKEVILNLLKEPTSGDQGGAQDAKQRPKVISIVGFPGVGKTALARAVYEHCAGSRDFDCVAWVEASGFKNRTALLGKILEKVQTDLENRGGVLQKLLDLGRELNKRYLSKGEDDIAAALQGILARKRYLVFIDDVRQPEVWDDTVRDFPAERGKGSMLIVTTRVYSIANVCSSGSYVYIMQCLQPKQSNDLFWKHVYPSESDPAPALHSGSDIILSKCDGLPLALISVAKYLRITKGANFDHDDCGRVSEELGRHLVGGEAEGFNDLRMTLGQCYEDLPGSHHKTSMLYLSIFPMNHPIKTKTLVRRLTAEGLAAGDGRECLDELINRCIVEPVKIGSCSKDVKSCRVNGGIMLEFLIQKSKFTNLVTLIRKEEVVRNDKGRIRRLSVQSSAEGKIQEVGRNIGLSGIRSLTIFSGNLPIPPKKITKWFKKENCKFLRLLDLEDCKFLRLLDLEGSKGLDEELLRGICQLVYLKYLSLRRTDVKNIPKEIKKLQFLQTLDIRETKEIIKLPIQVIMLPKLAFLFGHFVLPELSSDTERFLSEESELHTLAGFVVHEEGSEHTILKAKNLRKVKVTGSDTCAIPEPETSINQKSSKLFQRSTRVSPLVSKKDFVSSLQSRFTSLHSVSIESSQLSQDVLASLDLAKSGNTIRRMKLLGELVRLPCIDTLSALNNLSKLQLSYTGLTSEVLSTLQHISCLEYLKLQDSNEGSWGGSFSVLKDGFESLRRLCFQAAKLPKLEFDTGSMKSLTSLHLLCPDISQMQVAEEVSKSISNITRLSEVILHASATREIVEAWETAAKSNPNRPCVNQLQEKSSERPAQ